MLAMWVMTHMSVHTHFRTFSKTKPDVLICWSAHGSLRTLIEQLDKLNSHWWCLPAVTDVWVHCVALFSHSTLRISQGLMFCWLKVLYFMLWRCHFLSITCCVMLRWSFVEHLVDHPWWAKTWRKSDLNQNPGKNIWTIKGDLNTADIIIIIYPNTVNLKRVLLKSCS